MGGMIRADFKKMFRRKSLYICMFIAAALGVGMAMLYNYFWQERGNRIAMTYGIMEMYGMDTSVLDEAFSTIPKQNLWAFVNSFLTDEVKWIMSSICICSLVASEFAAGTFKNLVARGFSREKIYFSKLISCFAEALLVTVAYVGAGAITSLFNTTSPTEAPASEIVLTLAVYLLLLAAMTSLFMCLCVLFKSTGLAVAAAIAGPVLILTVFNLVVMANPDAGVYMQYFLMQTFITVNERVKEGEILTPLLTGGGYLAVTLLTGCIVFRKSELK